MATQELPRASGYPAIRYQRNLPSRGFSGLVLMTGITAICGVGMYFSIQAINERRELKREKIWTRIHLTPLLMAEYDRDVYRREMSLRAKEAELMKNVEGWDVNEKVYHTDRYVPRKVIAQQH